MCEYIGFTLGLDVSSFLLLTGTFEGSFMPITPPHWDFNLLCLERESFYFTFILRNILLSKWFLNKILLGLEKKVKTALTLFSLGMEEMQHT